MNHSIADKVHLALRRQLGEATEDVPDAEQLRIIPAIADKYPHSIRLLEEAVADRRETWVHNCHTYTFGLLGSEEVLRHTRRTIFPNAAYVTSLIATVLIETDNPADGDFVVYFQDGMVKHSGI